MSIQPPRLAKTLLRWFCHTELLEETEGDLDELFRERIQQGQTFRAKMKYWTDVFRTIKPYRSMPRRSYFSQSAGWPDKLRHFYIIAIRNMLRSRTSSAINLIGLALSLSGFLMIALYLQDELTFDAGHTDPDNTYRISYSYVGFDGKEDRDSRAAGLWSVALKEASPEIKSVVRFSRFGYPGNVWSESPDHVFVEQHFFWVDSTFTDIFMLPLKTSGDVRSILRDPHAVIINETTAHKYFGDGDAVGKAMTYVRDGMSFELVVGAVMKNYPSNSHFKPDFIANCTALVPLWNRNNEDRINSWGDSFSYSFIRVDPGTDMKRLGSILQGLFNKHLGDFAKTTHPVFVPLRDIHFTTGYKFELDAPGDKTHLYIFGAIALLIISMACINYMNLATARSVRRSKEVGLRKTLGAAKGSLVAQFIGESLMMTFIATVMALILLLILLPFFNDLTSKSFTLFSLLQAKTVWMLIGSTAAIGIISGSYPAFYLSAFKPIQVLKGMVAPARTTEQFRKALVVVQISVTMLFLTGAYVINKQLAFIDHAALSEFKDQIVTVRLGGDVPRERISGYRDLVMRDARVSGITTGPHIPRNENFGEMGRLYSFPAHSDAEYNWEQFDTDADFATMFGLEFIAGRNFSPQNLRDTAAIILNEAAVKELGLTPENALGLQSEDITFYFVNGERIKITTRRNVIGVVKDFSYASVKRIIGPIAISGNFKGAEMMYIKMTEGDYAKTLEYLHASWKKIYPATPFQYWFLDDEFGRLYRTERQMEKVFSALASMAILIACLGLFGLASFTAEQKTREIGIRKVLGASSSQILIMLTRRFVKLALIAVVIGVPLALLAVHSWMETFAYKAEIGSGVYIISSLIVSLFTLAVVALESLRAAMTNPAEAVRCE